MEGEFRVVSRRKEEVVVVVVMMGSDQIRSDHYSYE
jgi:hypothetical protein